MYHFQIMMEKREIEGFDVVVDKEAVCVGKKDDHEKIMKKSEKPLQILIICNNSNNQYLVQAHYASVIVVVLAQSKFQ
ncbi:hypothetical protein BpHYR1_025875 [Brachionus plicatilis]|uniref:Uncharacterized protein n=1 Tax=Brachionus plicatilis TaxID=10195 RepID=A0A3M7SJZ7_BRAPC|nr:hypothetical protein BpHYR1_025875 [Brachionus plicatilis]